MMKHVVRMKNIMIVIHIVNVHVLILMDLRNHAIICVRLVAFVWMVMFEKLMKTVHASKKLNVKIIKEDLFIQGKYAFLFFH